MCRRTPTASSKLLSPQRRLTTRRLCKANVLLSKTNMSIKIIISIIINISTSNAPRCNSEPRCR